MQIPPEGQGALQGSRVRFRPVGIPQAAQEALPGLRAHVERSSEYTKYPLLRGIHTVIAQGRKGLAGYLGDPDSMYHARIQ